MVARFFGRDKETTRLYTRNVVIAAADFGGFMSIKDDYL